MPQFLGSLHPVSLLPPPLHASNLHVCVLPTPLHRQTPLMPAFPTLPSPSLRPPLLFMPRQGLSSLLPFARRSCSLSPFCLSPRAVLLPSHLCLILSLCPSPCLAPSLTHSLCPGPSPPFSMAPIQHTLCGLWEGAPVLGCHPSPHIGGVMIAEPPERRHICILG